jgi:benzoate membrane transport protein
VKSGLVSTATAALVATVAGVGGTLPVVLAAAQAVGATPGQASSWVSGLGLATALSALALSVRYRMPIITAWSTPGPP